MRIAPKHKEEHKSHDAMYGRLIGGINQIKYDSLNLRERQVASLFGEGKNDEVIAKKLHLPICSIDELRSSLKGKLQFDSKKEFNDFVRWVSAYLNL